MIKYYGGKTKLVKIFEKYLPTENFENIIDLFVGGGMLYWIIRKKVWFRTTLYHQWYRRKSYKFL